MKLNLILFFSFCLGVFNAQSQEFKLNTNGATQIMVSNLFGKIQLGETSGSELVISAKHYEKKDIPEKAKGLKPISPLGEDNTSMGINVELDAGVVHVMGVNKASMDAEYYILAPKNTAVSIDYNNPFTYGEIEVDGFSSELEINTLSEDINLKNVTGPVVLHSVSGNITVDFTTVNQESPMSISAVSGDVDLAMPESTPVSFYISTINGEVYTDFDIKMDRKDKEGLTYLGGGHKLNGKVNGGGVEMEVKSVSNNIYLRKK